jgi:hypothetical protein
MAQSITAPAKRRTNQSEMYGSGCFAVPDWNAFNSLNFLSAPRSMPVGRTELPKKSGDYAVWPRVDATPSHSIFSPLPESPNKAQSLAHYAAWRSAKATDFSLDNGLAFSVSEAVANFRRASSQMASALNRADQP